MNSIHSQSDFGHRTIDFFDDKSTSDDDIPTPALPVTDAPGNDLLERSGSIAVGKRRSRVPPDQNLVSQCESRRSVGNPDAEGYQRLAQQDEHIRFADDETPRTSFDGSVTELLQGEHSSPPQMSTGTRAQRGRTPSSAAQVDHYEDQDDAGVSPKNDQILAAHAIAHEITLQALMRDEGTLDRSIQTFAPMDGGHRASLLPASLRVHDPRSPRNQNFSSPKSAASNKKVQIVPPPIDTSGPRRSLPADLVRTPYPYTPEKAHRKDSGRSPLPAETSPRPTSESVLTLNVRRSNPNSRPRLTRMVIPSPNGFSAIGAMAGVEKPHHFHTGGFDDAEFFRQLHRNYRQLTGPWHFLSARSLQRIVVSGAASQEADAGYGWLHPPRSPCLLAYQGRHDTFGEEKILQHYRHPTQGRSRYAFVHWAHRLAAAPPLQTPQGDRDAQATVERDLARRMEQPEGLEFVVSWSIKRIVLALLGIVALSMAAAFLWIFLGRSTPA